MTPAIEALQTLMRDPQVGWSLGRRGAIAEFYWDNREPVIRSALSVATSRGALRIACGDSPQLFAGEGLSHAGSGWSQWLSLCLPKGACAMRGDTVVNEIGPDTDALQEQGRQSILFDLGIGGAYYQLNVRADSADLATELRAAAGRPLLESDALMRSLVATSPTRVFESHLARIEVHQPIALPGGKSPEGPHTHLLPNLIRGDGADPGNAPSGWIAQIVAYPPHPLRDAHGESKPFDVRHFEAFQAWLAAFGDPGHRLVKRTVAEAIRAGASPNALDIDTGRRDSVRVALRQLRHIDGESAVLARWREAYD